MVRPQRGRGDASPFLGSKTLDARSRKSAEPRLKVPRVRHPRNTYISGVIDGERVLVANEPRETEKGLMLRIRAALAVIPGVLVWRNNVGVDSQRGIRYGLGVGSADLVGLVNVKGVGVFLGVEVKTDTGRIRPEQTRWIATVRRFGGIAVIARSPEEAVAAIEAARA